MPDREPPPPPLPPTVGHAFLHGPFARPPRTPVGWGSVVLAATYVAVSAIHRLVVGRVADAASSSALRTGFEVAILAIGVATAATVAIALGRRAERSWLLGVPLLIGLGTVVYLLGAAFGRG